jgi:acyl-CoA synthetase (NDP forming)
VTDHLHPFFHPRGVTVLGASANTTKLSHGVLRNLVTQGYRGPVYPVNPKGGAMLGLRVHTSVAEVPDPVDLAVIVLSADRTVEALEACGRRGIKAAVVNEALCKGCGACAAGCRSGAVDVQGFTDAQIVAAIEAL